MSKKVPAEPKAIIPLLDYQQRDIEDPARFAWSCWSRQIGKSFAKALKRTIRGIKRQRLQVLLSAGERQSRELMDKVRMHVQALGVFAKYQDDATFEGTSFKQLEITIPGKCRIIGLPANPATARGFTGDAFLDEFALHKDSREIWAALFPTVLRGNGELDVASTPKGKSNVFYQLKNNPRFSHSTVTIEDAIRDGLEVDLDELREAMNDEELYRQEFLCEFIDEATAFLTYEQIIRCENPDIEPPIKIGPQDRDFVEKLAALVESIVDGGEFYAGWDVARGKDLSVVWILEKVDGRLITRGVIEMRNVKFSVQCVIVSLLLEKRGLRHIAIDGTKGSMGQPIAEFAQEQYGDWRVDGVNFTLESKGLMAGQLRHRVEDVSIEIPGCESVRNDWHSIQKIVSTGGTVRYHADRTPDGHADRFWAAALAVDAATTREAAWDGKLFSGGRGEWGRFKRNSGLTAGSIDRAARGMRQRDRLRDADPSEVAERLARRELQRHRGARV